MDFRCGGRSKGEPDQPCGYASAPRSPHRIILPFIKAQKGGVETTIDKLEAHYLAGGNVDNVVDALIAATRADIPISFERAAAIDLAGRNVLEAVQMSVNPKVIETP